MKTQVFFIFNTYLPRQMGITAYLFFINGGSRIHALPSTLRSFFVECALPTSPSSNGVSDICGCPHSGRFPIFRASFFDVCALGHISPSFRPCSHNMQTAQPCIPIATQRTVETVIGMRRKQRLAA